MVRISSGRDSQSSWHDSQKLPSVSPSVKIKTPDPFIDWTRFDEESNAGFEPDGDRGTVMTVIENNHLSGARRGVLMAPPANWTRLRNNSIQLTTPHKPLVEYYGRDLIVAPLAEGNE